MKLSTTELAALTDLNELGEKMEELNANFVKLIETARTARDSLCARFNSLDARLSLLMVLTEAHDAHTKATSVKLNRKKKVTA